MLQGAPDSVRLSVFFLTSMLFPSSPIFFSCALQDSGSAVLCDDWVEGKPEGPADAAAVREGGSRVCDHH